MTAPDSTMAQISRRMLSAKAEQFTESVIREMTRLAMKHHAVNLSQGFPDFAAPEEIKEAARQAIAEDINQYAITWGAKPLRDAVVEKFARAQGVRYDPEREITVCCGSTEAMMSAMMAIINPGDEIVVFEPFYENYGPDAILSGASPRFVKLRPPDWSFDEKELSAAFGPHTKAIILNTPNNPTGKVFTRSELEFIRDLCVRWNTYCITDEIYEHILFDGGHGNVLRAVIKNVFVDFVGDAIGVPANAKVADEFEFGAREDFAGGIVRRVENDRFGVRAEGGGKFFFVKRPIRRTQFDEARAGAAENCVRTVIFVERLEHHNLIAWIDDGHHRGQHRFRGAVADGDLALRVVADALGSGKFFNDGIPQRFCAPGDGVLIDVLGDGLPRGFLDFFGRRKIGEALREIHRVMLHRQARHFADDGFGELLGFGREHAPGDLSHGGIRSRHCTFPGR